MTEHQANIPNVIASNYRNQLAKLPGWIAEDFVGYLTVVLVQAYNRYNPDMGATLETFLFGSVKLAARGYWEKFRQQKRAHTLCEWSKDPEEIRIGYKNLDHETVDIKDTCEYLENQLPPRLWQLLKTYYLEEKPLNDPHVSRYLLRQELRLAEETARRILRNAFPQEASDC